MKRTFLLLAFVSSIALLQLAGSASALDAIDPGDATAAAGECPVLVQIKYPFVTCSAGASGFQPGSENASWEQDRRMPQMSDWTENDDWHPSQTPGN